MEDPGLAEIIHALTLARLQLPDQVHDAQERIGVDMYMGHTISLLDRAIARRACGETATARRLVRQARDTLLDAKVYARHGDAWVLEDWLEMCRECLAQE